MNEYSEFKKESESEHVGLYFDTLEGSIQAFGSSLWGVSCPATQRPPITAAHKHEFIHE